MKFSFKLVTFYHTTRTHSADYAVARCLSVCLSHAGIVSKQLYISSNFFQQRVVPPSYPTPNGMAIFRQEPPNKGDECKGGMKKSRFSTNISLYLTMMQDRAIVTMEGK